MMNSKLQIVNAFEAFRVPGVPCIGDDDYKPTSPSRAAAHRRALDEKRIALEDVARDARRAERKRQREIEEFTKQQKFAGWRAQSSALAKPVAAELPTWGGWNEPVLPPVYLLEGLMPEGKVVTLYAEGGSLKSWVAFALALAVATGSPCLGRAVLHGKALVLDYEDGRHEVQRRRQILSPSTEDVPDLGYLYQPARLNDPELWNMLATLGLRLVVIDTLGAGMPGDADENDATFAEGLKLAGKFTETMGGKCTVVIVAHANKQGGLRGASAIRDQSDVVFKFEPVSETDHVKRMRMICDKPGPQKRPAPVNVELSDAGLRTFEDQAQAIGRNAEAAIDVRAAVKLVLSRGPVLTKDLIREAVGAKREKVASAIDALRAKGEIALIENVGYVLDGPAERRARVLEQVRAFDGWASAAKLATAAYVTTRFVAAMIRGGEICARQSGANPGGFFVVERNRASSNPDST